MYHHRHFQLLGAQNVFSGDVDGMWPFREDKTVTGAELYHTLVLYSPSAMAKKWPKYFLLGEAVSRKSKIFSDEPLYRALW